MIRYSTLVRVISDYTEKCSDYPKYQAFKYWKKYHDQFEEESWDSGNGRFINNDESPVGHLQQAQEDLQDEVNYTNLEKEANHRYSVDYFNALQIYNNGGDYETEVYDCGGDVVDGECILPTVNHYGEDWSFDWTDTVAFGEDFMGDWSIEDTNIKDIDQAITSSIEKSPVLLQDTVMHRWGELPDDLEVGNHGVFKGYTGMSFNEKVPKDIKTWAGWGDHSHRYMIKVYAMGGTKGMVLYPHNGCRDWQSEWLCGKNQRYILLSRDDDEMTAEILLY